MPGPEKFPEDAFEFSSQAEIALESASDEQYSAFQDAVSMLVTDGLMLKAGILTPHLTNEETEILNAFFSRELNMIVIVRKDLHVLLLRREDVVSIEAVFIFKAALH